MAVDDGIDDAILLQDTDGLIDGLLQLGMILSHTDGERGSIEGFGQDTERWIHPLECLGWRLIGHHTVYLTLQECLDGIGSLVVPFYLGAISFLFQLRSKSVASSTELHTNHSSLQISLALDDCLSASDAPEPHATKSTLRSKAKKPSLNFPVFLYFIIPGIRLLLFQILSTHLCTSFSVHTSRNDSTCIASTFTTWEESLDADMLQGFAVTDDADRR